MNIINNLSSVNFKYGSVLSGVRIDYLSLYLIANSMYVKEDKVQQSELLLLALQVQPLNALTYLQPNTGSVWRDRVYLSLEHSCYETTSCFSDSLHCFATVEAVSC